LSDTHLDNVHKHTTHPDSEKYETCRVVDKNVSNLVSSAAKDL
jgi:hypothetical protein